MNHLPLTIVSEVKLNNARFTEVTFLNKVTVGLGRLRLGLRLGLGIRVCLGIVLLRLGLGIV